MKTIYLITIAALCLAFKISPSDNYTINPAKSKVKWTGHADAGTYSPSGTIGIKSGMMDVKDARLLSAMVVIDMNTIEQENKELEHHLKNPDFFDCEKYQEAVFKLISISGNMAVGSLTIKGVTQKVSFPVTIKKLDSQIIIQANLKVDRTKFGIKYNSASFFQDLGSYAIKNEFDLDIMLVGESK